ncbi:hypothetical protein HanHA89_Chr11g0437401 [Helianthus annuus]|nr:hypothetical protein HanHA89_Chr11g0437401 [Helianthus annuus]
MLSRSWFLNVCDVSLVFSSCVRGVSGCVFCQKRVGYRCCLVCWWLCYFKESHVLSCLVICQSEDFRYRNPIFDLFHYVVVYMALLQMARVVYSIVWFWYILGVNCSLLVKI